MATNGILRFVPNKPERIALAGKAELCESTIDGAKPDWKCRLVGGRVAYLREAVKKQIEEMGMQLNEPIDVTQTLSQHGKQKIWGWSVRRVEGEQQPGNHLNGNSPAAAATTTEMLQAPQPQRTSYTNIMTSCWIAAIDAMLQAQRYAEEKGIAFPIEEESLRCCANAIFIAYDRKNGGAR